MLLVTPHPRHYVLEEDMLAYYLSDLIAWLSKKDKIGGWDLKV